MYGRARRPVAGRTSGARRPPRSPAERMGGLARRAGVPRSDSRLVAYHVHRLANRERGRRGRRALVRDRRLDAVAQRHAADMSRRNYFSHTSPGGSTPTSRGERAGYTCSKASHAGLAENIFCMAVWARMRRLPGGRAGFDWIRDERRLASTATRAWMGSTRHRRNVLDAGFSRLGVGVHVSGRGTAYFVQNFC